MEQLTLQIITFFIPTALDEDAWKYAKIERDNPNKSVDTRRRFQQTLVSLIK